MAAIPRLNEIPLHHLRCVNLARLKQHQAQQLTRIIRETGDTLPDRTTMKLPGDPQALRGVPIVGRGIGGVQRGTQPEAETIRRWDQ
jgi:hypothetical protein